MSTEDLSDEQLHQLLRSAAERLKASQQALVKGDEKSLSLPLSLPRTTNSNALVPSSYIKTDAHGAHVDPSRLVAPETKKLANGPRTVESAMSKKLAKKTEKATVGSDWFDLPKTNLTPELKRDLQLLKMRNVLDPKRHYKKENNNKIPEYSQVGTIIEGPTEFFSARLTNKERKQTLADEVLAAEKSNQKFKSKYNQIQEAKTSGKKAHYKALKAKRKGKKS